MPEPLFRLGIIGAGLAAEALHLPGALASPLVEVTAIVDPVTNRAQALAKGYGLSVAIAERVQDVLSNVDGVVIATPNHTHAEIAIACLKAGTPCLVEKPLATSVAEGQAMCAAARESGKVLAVGYSTRFRDEVVLLHDLLRDGFFGAVHRFHYQEGSVGGWSPQSAYILNRAQAGGGVLTVVGTHFLDRMLYWFGYPSTATLADDSTGGPEAHCLARFRFDREQPLLGTLLLSKLVPLKAGLVIETDEGDVIFPMGRSALQFYPRHRPGLRTILAPRGSRLFDAEKGDAQLTIENFVAACRGTEPPMVDGEQGLLSLRLLEALYANRVPAELAQAASS